MTYTIKLVGLECFKSEEIDGDDIYIKLNDDKVWAVHPERMSHTADHEHFVSQFDFAGGRKLTQEGWQMIMPYDPGDYIFKDQSGNSVLQLWEIDLLTKHDLFGQTPIDEAQATGGNISVIFRRQGAHYRLTYKVEA